MPDKRKQTLRELELRPPATGFGQLLELLLALQFTSGVLYEDYNK